MNILIVSTYGESAPLAYRFKTEGHKVIMWIKDEHLKTVMDGIINKTDDWHSELETSDLIIFDDTGFGKEAEKLTEQGYSVIGGNEYTDKIELDRAFGQQEMEAIGLEILPTEKFSNIEKAKEYIFKNPGRYVIKPDGKGGDDKALTYVGKDENGDDIISQLDHYEKQYAKKISSIEIQQYIEGVEVAVSAFFNGKNFVEPVEISFEHKKLMNNDIGPNTGEMGTTMFWTDFNNKLFQEILYPIWDRIQGYHGYIDINCIMSDDKVYPLEYTCRFGYPTIQLKMETIENDLGEWLYGLANGATEPLKVHSDYSACVVIATPPFPYEDKKSFEKYSEDSLIIIENEDKSGYWPSEVKEEDGEWLIAGMTGYPLVVTGSGSSMEEAIEMAYDRVSKVIISNMMYRTDIGSKWKEESKVLSESGWI
jgi:phosphoribosylamine--glycine ligase